MSGDVVYVAARDAGQRSVLSTSPLSAAVLNRTVNTQCMNVPACHDDIRRVRAIALRDENEEQKPGSVQATA